MRGVFNIYPALFILTPVTLEESIQTIDRTSRNKRSNSFGREACLRSWPQAFWGDCLFNENHKQLVLPYNNDMNACVVQQFLNGKSTVLKPAKFKGKRYVITYIPVLN